MFYSVADSTEEMPSTPPPGSFSNNFTQGWQIRSQELVTFYNFENELIWTTLLVEISILDHL